MHVLHHFPMAKPPLVVEHRYLGRLEMLLCKGRVLMHDGQEPTKSCFLSASVQCGLLHAPKPKALDL